MSGQSPKLLFSTAITEIKRNKCDYRRSRVKCGVSDMRPKEAETKKLKLTDNKIILVTINADRRLMESLSEFNYK